jgi:hypothetical protein
MKIASYSFFGSKCFTFIGPKVVAILPATLACLFLPVHSSRGFQTVSDMTSQKASIVLAQVASTEIPKKITDIRFEATQEGEEKVIFALNGFYPPKSFSIEGDQPRVVCDFFGTRLANSIIKQTTVGGQFIQQIRIGIHKGNEPKIRVVLDLVPEKQYKVKQLFFKEEHVYTLIVGQGQ